MQIVLSLSTLILPNVMPRAESSLAPSIVDGITLSHIK